MQSPFGLNGGAFWSNRISGYWMGSPISTARSRTYFRRQNSRVSIRGLDKLPLARIEGNVSLAHHNALFEVDLERRQAAGAEPNFLLKARENAASDS